MTERLSIARIVTLAAAGAALGFCCWFFGVDVWYATGFALVFVALGIVWASIGGTDVPDWQATTPEHPAGARDDVVRLAWSLRMHKGQVHEPAYKRLRSLAAERLAPHRLEIDDPADRASIESMIGATGYRALHAPGGRLPSLTAVENCLEALDALTGDPPPPRPSGAGDPVKDAIAYLLTFRPIAALLGRRSTTHDRR
ncbi:MAG TPA: hypothetical protein VN133_04450 [Humibacter sp.]|nr:hypothetical protein [Humibacter sp.]